MTVAWKRLSWLIASIGISGTWFAHDLYNHVQMPPACQKLDSFSATIANPATGIVSFPDGESLQILDVRGSGKVSEKGTVSSTGPFIAWDTNGNSRPLSFSPDSKPEPGTVVVYVLSASPRDSDSKKPIRLEWPNFVDAVRTERTIVGTGMGKRVERLSFTFRTIPQRETLRCGYRDYRHSTILTQVALSPVLSTSFGSDAVVKAISKEAGQIAIVLKPAFRPEKKNGFWCEVQSINATGDIHTEYGTEINIGPNTESIELPCPNVNPSWKTVAVRVVLTPYRWAEFTDLPLVPIRPSATSVRSGLPIPPTVKRILTEKPDKSVAIRHPRPLARVSQFPDIHSVIPAPDTVLVTSEYRNEDGSDVVDYRYVVDATVPKRLVVFLPSWLRKSGTRVNLYRNSNNSRSNYDMGPAFSVEASSFLDIDKYCWVYPDGTLPTMESVTVMANPSYKGKR